MAKTTKTAAKAAKPKKPAAKKPAAKKPAVKKAAAKKPAAKKPVVKKAADVKKPVAKKASAKKPAVKAAVKTAAKKPATAKPKTASENIKFRNLFDAFEKGKLPFAEGYIISSFFSERTAYSIYEIVSYAGVKEIFPSGTGLQFVAGGKKLHILVENDTYAAKYQEPVARAQGESIPKRFNELEKIIARNQTTIYVAKEPNEITGSFTVLKPVNLNFAVVFYQLPDVIKTIAVFFQDSLNNQRKVPQSDAKKAAELIASTVEKTMGSKGEFE
ncbi:MAG: hypothetical protein LBQ93_02025 [Treponema sp.]|jgi:hypothetical protein|nr:hypothetical protein [Treponema sp.]